MRSCYWGVITNNKIGQTILNQKESIACPIFWLYHLWKERLFECSEHINVKQSFWAEAIQGGSRNNKPLFRKSLANALACHPCKQNKTPLTTSGKEIK